MGLFDNGKAGRSTNAPETSFSPIFHSGSIAEFTTNVGYKASNVLWAKDVRKQFTLAARVVSTSEKSASFVGGQNRIGLRADLTYNAWCQLRNVGKMIREVIQEVVY